MSFSIVYNHEELVQIELINHKKTSPQTVPQDLINTHYDCEDHQQKTLQKNAINQFTLRKSEPESNQSTTVVVTIFF